MSDNDVVLYYKSGCPFAARLRAGLKLARIPYSAVRFGDDTAAAAKIREVNGGNEISPTVRVGQKTLTNPSVGEVRRSRAAR
jgi:mycoredoxin